MRNFTWILIIVFISSCQENSEKWKLPTDVSVSFEFSRSVTLNNKLHFHDGEIILKDFRFDGERDQGDDVYFEKPFHGGYTVYIDPSQSMVSLNFDIPQGSYSIIEIELEIESDTMNSIVLKGSYTHSNGTELPLRFETKSAEIYAVIAKDINGNNNITLNTDIPSNAIVSIDPVHWFEIVSTNLLDNADIVNYQGVQTIVINESINEDIFDIVADRIGEATEITFY